MKKEIGWSSAGDFMVQHYDDLVATLATLSATPAPEPEPCTYYGCPYPTNPRYDHDHPAQETTP